MAKTNKYKLVDLKKNNIYTNDGQGLRFHPYFHWLRENNDTEIPKSNKNTLKYKQKTKINPIDRQSGLCAPSLSVPSATAKVVFPQQFFEGIGFPVPSHSTSTFLISIADLSPLPPAIFLPPLSFLLGVFFCC